MTNSHCDVVARWSHSLALLAVVVRGLLTSGTSSRQTCTFYQKVNYLLSAWQGGCVCVNGCNETDCGIQRAEFLLFFSHFLRGEYVNAYEKDTTFILTRTLCRSRSYIYFLLHVYLLTMSQVSSNTPLYFVPCHFHIRDDWRHIVFDRCESDCWEIDNCEME